MSESIKAGLMAAVLMSLAQSAIALPPIAATLAEPNTLIPEKTVVPAWAKLDKVAAHNRRVTRCFFMIQACK